MKSLRLKNEIVILIGNRKVINVLIPCGEPTNLEDWHPGSVIRYDAPITVVDLGDKNEG